MSDKTIEMPTIEDEQLLDEIIEDSATEVGIKDTKKKYRIGWMKKGTMRKITSVTLKKGDDDMSITATELKLNLGKYLMLAETEDIYITRNGKVVAKLSNPYQDRVDVAKSLFGTAFCTARKAQGKRAIEVPNDMTLEEAREERLNTI